MSNSSNKKKNKSKKAGIKIDNLPNDQVEVQSNEEVSSSNEEEIIIEITPPQELVIEEETSTDVTNANSAFKTILDNVGDELKEEAINQTNKLLISEFLGDNNTSNNTLEQTVESVIVNIGKELIQTVAEEIKEEIAELKEEVKELVQKVSSSARIRIGLLRNRK